MGLSSDMQKADEDNMNLNTILKKFMAGGVAGVCVWTISFPADAIKTKMQTNTGERLSFTQVAREIINTTGFRRLYRGI